MMKIAFLYPADVTANREHHSHALLFKLFEKLPYKVIVIGRIPEARFRETTDCCKLSYVNIFDNKAFENCSTSVEEAEKKLGLPFLHIFCSNYKRWGWTGSGSLLENYVKATPYIEAWEDILKDVDIVIPTIDNLFFTYSGEGIAKYLGKKIIKPVRGRLLNDTMMFWNGENLPIYYKNKDDYDIYKRFSTRESHVKTDKAAVNKVSNLINGLIWIPDKIFSKASKHDVDTPSLLDKYPVLIYRALRFIIMPYLHSTGFNQPDYSERYFLFSLHYEWESQLAYREPFINQQRLIEDICKCLPNGTKLYVKVHPHWRNADQPLASLPYDAKYIHPDTNTTQLIKNSIGVITINSTVGYEAMLQNKPVIVFGHEEYGSACIKINNLSDLPEAMIRVYKINKLSHDYYEGFLKRYCAQISDICDKDKLVNDLKKVIEEYDKFY